MRQRGKLTAQGIAQTLPGGVEKDDDRSILSERLDRGIQGFRAENHARSPAIRVVVNRPMAPQAMLPQVVNGHGQEPVLHGPANDACLQGRVEQLGEERDDIDAHRGHRTSSDA